MEFRSGPVLGPWAWLCLMTLWVSQPSPDGPGKHQDGYRWPLAPRPPQITPRTAIPDVRPGLPARFPHRDPESPADACLGRHRAPNQPLASPQRPRCAGSWRNSSHFLEMLQSQALGAQPLTHRLAPPPVSTAFTRVAGSLSPSYGRHPQTHALQRSCSPRRTAEVVAKLVLRLGQVAGVAPSPVAGTPRTRRVART